MTTDRTSSSGRYPLYSAPAIKNLSTRSLVIGPIRPGLRCGVVKQNATKDTSVAPPSPPKKKPSDAFELFPPGVLRRWQHCFFITAIRIYCDSDSECPHSRWFVSRSFTGRLQAIVSYAPLRPSLDCLTLCLFHVNPSPPS
jgi:hypothetical protein